MNGVRIELRGKAEILLVALASLKDPEGMAEILEVEPVEIVHQACSMLLGLEFLDEDEAIMIREAMKEGAQHR